MHIKCIYIIDTVHLVGIKMCDVIQNAWNRKLQNVFLFVGWLVGWKGSICVKENLLWIRADNLRNLCVFD
jgi:hypothetical protein